MNSLNFLDANVWLALAWNRHAHSQPALQWFTRAASEQFFFCRFTQLTLLRLLTQSAVMGRDVKSCLAAWEIYEQILADERISFLPEPDDLDLKFKRLSRTRSPSPKLWADAYLSAFAGAAGIKLVTFDKAFQSRSTLSRFECLILS